ncbi:MAG TPA: hypothetical protein VND93_16765 [Myxococcales bacterium]|nr:hypothetical protein [Myxococcales bacterium]
MSLISFFKPPATVAKPAPAPATTVPAAKPAAATQPAPSFKADSFQPAKASPSRMPVLFSQPPPQV